MRTIALCCLFFAAATSSHGAWTTFHGNNQRNGRTPAIVPTNSTLKWSRDLNGPMVTGPVVGPDGTIYIANQDESKVPKNYLNALRPDGSVKWRHLLPWFEDLTLATPAVDSSGRVYGGTANGFFYCIHPDGQLLWSKQFSRPIRSHTLIHSNGTIFAVFEHNLTAMDASGMILWQSDLGENVYGGATEGLDGNVYIYSSTGLRSYTPTGALRWTTVVPRASAPPGIAPNGDVISFGTYPTAVDPASGAIRWSAYTFTFGAYSTPAIDGQGNLYYGSDYDLFKVTSAGTIAIERSLEDPNSSFLGHTWASPVIDGANQIFLSLGNGKRSAIEFEKRVLILNTNLDYTGAFVLPHIPGTSVPAVTDGGRLIVGCLDGRVYCFGN